MTSYGSQRTRRLLPGLMASIILCGLSLMASIVGAEPHEVIAIAALDAPKEIQAEADIVSAMLRTEIVRDGSWEVVEKQHMDKILSEQAFQYTGCTSEECAVRLGRILNAKKILVGSYGVFRNTGTLSIRLLDV